jgi:hypothetical protein
VRDDAAVRVEVSTAMDTVSVSLRESASRHERGHQHLRSPILSYHNLGSSDLLLASCLVTHGAGEVSEDLFFSSYFLGESVWLPFKKCSYNIGVHGLEHM